MGIPGLINAIGRGERISLAKLAISHLERTDRPIRIAVDISIWLFQVQAGRGGKNPELRTLFYRLLKILALPVHPLFVFDGKNKPPFKRGKAVRTYGSAPIIRQSKALIDLFRFPIHDAPGEAEAECAKLQERGIVDMVMTNDVDALMFGSTSTIMNYSKESGSGTTAATHVSLYQVGKQTIASKPVLDRAGMILFAMLSGGDYDPNGVPKCGSKLAAEIARAGFGQDLLDVIKSDASQLDAALDEWRARLQYELEENESGYFQTKHKAVRIPEKFPDRTILAFYAQPLVSDMHDLEALKSRLSSAWDREIDVQQLRQFAAEFFEWNYRSGARKVIRSLAEPLVSQRLRLGKLLNPSFLSNSNTTVLQKIYKDRTAFSTDGLPEFQVDIIPIDVVGLDLLAEEPNPPLPSQESMVSGDEEEDQELLAEPAAQSPVKKRVTKRYDPYVPEKIWVFKTLAELGTPNLVEMWKKELAEKAAAKKKPAQRKTGPRKKGPIDPKMKSGSILKYGSLTKPSSDMSQFKQAQLFDAAVSATPKPGVLGTQSHQGSPKRFMGNSPIRDVYLRNVEGLQQYTSFDDLADVFSSSCTISPTGIKRPPIAHRPRVGMRRAVSCSNGTEVEDLEVSSPLESSPRLSLSGGIRMSYSNASYQNQAVETYTTSTEDTTLPSLASNRRRQNMSKKPTETGYHSQGSGEIEQIKHALSSLSLTKHERSHEAGVECEKTTISTRTRRSKKAAQESKIELDNLKEQAKEKVDHSEKTNVTSIHEENTRNPSKPGGSKLISLGTRQHMESVTIHNGYWTVETKTEQDSVESGEPSGRNETPEMRKDRKKRVPRVSILDLSEV